MSLFEQYKDWLGESKDTKTLMKLYVDYIKKHTLELSDELKADKTEITERAEAVSGRICDLIDLFLKGNIFGALHIADKLLDYICYREIEKDWVFFRARGNDRGYLYERDEMFHVPFDKRNIIENQRYSITGVPCLYLGGSAYICWEELSRPVFQTCNFSGFKNRESVYVYDLCLSEDIYFVEEIERIGIILACSLPAKSADLFKEEYVLPQCLLQAIINRRYCEEVQGIYGVKYISTHVLNNRRLMYEFDIAEEKSVDRFTNYVFPSVCSDMKSGHSPLLKEGFEYTSPCSYTDFLIRNEASFHGRNNDEYQDSYFGMIDHYIKSELGIKDNWEDGVALICKRG